MKISPIRSYYNNINFTSKVKKVINGNVPESVQEQIDIFEETDCANAEKLGEGLFAEAYRINGTDIVIKRSKPKNATSINGDFSQEAHALMNIPKDFQHAQRLIGNVETEYENFYLISTFMEGKIPDGDKIKWDRRSLSSILTSLAQLDTARVFHGDVSRCNCLITEDSEVNLLDFQYCDKFRLDDDYDHAQNAKRYKVPYFIAPSNAKMFEESNFATYLTTIKPSEAESLFVTYLEEKSKYHKTRAIEFQKQGVRPEIVEYDTLMAKYLEHPSKEMVELQAKKLQILLTQRYILSAMDTRKQEDLFNIMSAPVYYLQAIEECNDVAKFAEEMSSKTNDPDLKKLLYYEYKNAIFWRSMMKNELDGRHENSSAFEWILRNAKQAPRDMGDNIQSTFNKTGLLAHKDLPDVLTPATGSDTTFGFKAECSDDVSSWFDFLVFKIRSTNSFTANINEPAYKDIEEYHKMKREIMAQLRSARELYGEDKNYVALYHALGALYRTSLAKNKAVAIINSGKLSEARKTKMIDDAKFLDSYKDELQGACSYMYRTMFNKASEEE